MLRRAGRLLLVVVPPALLACGSAEVGPAPPPGPAPAVGGVPSAPRLVAAAPSAPAEVAPLHPSVASMSWILGHWQRRDGDGAIAEHWIAAGRSLWGIGFTTEQGVTASYEIMQIDADEAGALRLTAIPGGSRSVVFTKTGGTNVSAAFENPKNDFPSVIYYARDSDDELAYHLEAPGGQKKPRVVLRRSAPGRAAELEAADRAFAADVTAHGIDAWMAAFADDGIQWHRGSPARGAAIREAMAPLLTSPDTRLVWEPVTSALAPAGDIGFTVGRSQVLRRGPSGPMEEPGRLTYATLWRKQAGNVWKVIWDGGALE